MYSDSIWKEISKVSKFKMEIDINTNTPNLYKMWIYHIGIWKWISQP